MLDTGIHSDIPESEYHADPCALPSLSASLAVVLNEQSPLHAWTAHPRLNPNHEREDSRPMDIGRAAHALLLQGVDVAEYLPFADWRKNDAKVARDLARKAGKTPLLEHQRDEITMMVNAAKIQIAAHQDAANAFSDGKPEETLIWFEQEYGIWCRARLDWLSTDRRRITDLKTTGRSSNPEALSRSLFSDGLDIQEAFYRRGVKALTGIDADFKFVFVESGAPHAVSVLGLDPQAQIEGEKRVMNAMEIFANCSQSGKWPGYPSRTCYASVPGWLAAQWENKELSNAVHI